MLALEGVSRYRGERLLLRRIHFRLSPGRLTLLQGPNGAGKTTLWRILGGLLLPDEGRVLWEGKPLRREDWPRVYREVGLSGTEPFLHEDLTGYENLAFWATAFGFPPSEARAWLERMGLERAGDLPLHRYSLGQRKRLSLARAFLPGPSLVLLDEPFSSLDRDGQRLLADLLQEHRTRGGGALIIQHEVPEYLPVDEQYWLEGGTLRRVGTP